MPTVNFYLKKPPGRSPYSLIYLQFKYNGRKLVYSLGRKISPPDWSKETKRVKSNRQTILDGQYALNELLDKLEKHCLKVYREEMEKGIPPMPVLKFRLDAYLRQQEGGKKETVFYQLIDRFISGEIKNKGKDKSPNTLKNYSTAKTHLYAFDIKTRYHIHFENINLDFLERYVHFLKDELKLKPNSIARDIGVLKTVMSEAVDLGYTSNIQFRHKRFHIAGEKTDAVHLTQEELTRLYRFDCSGNKRLEQVRDLFVYCCLTGQRLIGPQRGDFPVAPTSSLARKRSSDGINVNNLIIKEIEGKPSITLPAAGDGSGLTVVCHPLVSKILIKYREAGGRLPKAPSNQKFNDYIKEVCCLAGLLEKGRLSTSPGQELWECVSSRTARLSMAAHYYREGYPVQDLMRVTGHSTEKAFLKYLRVLKEPLRGPES